MNVTRYDIDNREGAGFMAPEDDGRYVLYDDYKALAHEIAQISDVLYERFGKGKCGALVAVALIEKVVRESSK